ncbi:protein sel-1 homolog 3-like [Mya arenaria]|uniref:protein sel-1 homolog 3-like n=1 Tax=Mya arenaria TaxID=6604 RepID=UPI0022E12D43|nr:protein sel-1 homolog 3-like [Mya arenaria]
MDGHFVFVVVCIGIEIIKTAVGDPSTLSMVIDKRSNKLADFIQILDPPTSFSGDTTVIHVEYRCRDERYVGVEVLSDVIGVFKSQIDTSVKVFQKVFRCHKDSISAQAKVKKVQLKLPPYVGFNFNVLNKNVTFTSNTKLRAWILETEWRHSCKKHNNCFTRSFVKVAYESSIDPPFSRPYVDVKSSLRGCISYRSKIQHYATSFRIPTCDVENEVVELLSYPLVLSGDPYGVFRKLEPYKNPELEARRLTQILKPRFTLVVWLYMLDVCAHDRLCSVFHHFSWDSLYKSPLLFINSNGQLHVQVEHADGQHSAGVANDAVPLHTWLRVVFSFKINKWTLAVTKNRNISDTTISDYTHPFGAVYYNDTEGLFTLGGAETTPSVRGYIGHATLYRNVALSYKEVSMLGSDEPMFRLGLTRREERCSDFLSWVAKRIEFYKRVTSRVMHPDKCPVPFLELIKSVTKQPDANSVGDTCPAERTGRHRKNVDKLVRAMVKTRGYVHHKTVAKDLYKKASEWLDVSLDAVPRAFPVLKQAACLGSVDAMYVVAVLLNHGIHVKSDEIQSQAYLMLAALENQRLAALALGHKHRNGLHGASADLEHSFRYYKFVADTARLDKERHKDTDVFTESVRLTDERALHEQTDEDGDVFQWLSHQAKQGVLSAQNRVGRALFWGQQGLRRNLEAAVDYFRMSAETGDSQSQYDYGVVLMKGQGTKRDVDAGLQQIHKAAEQQNPSALNAIGWHAMNFERNYRKAAEYFERAHRLGNPDAMFNLGHMHLYGTYPYKEKDVDLALRYFFDAGTRNHLDAGVAIAAISAKGTGRQPRNVYTAAEWSRFIAEKTPAVGMVLRKGIKAFKAGKHDVSLFYYALAADAGLEIGAFNLAWLCEENRDGVTSFIEKECVWSQYNISIQREKQFVDSYALVKMGDYYWYGCEGHRNPSKAVDLYVQAATMHNPQALFNLGLLVEEGVSLSASALREVHVPQAFRRNNVTLLTHLYNRCRDSHQSEAFIPCSIALWRVQILDFWDRHQIFIKISTMAAAMLFTILSSYKLLRSNQGNAMDPQDENI